MKIKSMHQFIQ